MQHCLTHKTHNKEVGTYNLIGKRKTSIQFIVILYFFFVPFRALALDSLERAGPLQSSQKLFLACDLRLPGAYGNPQLVQIANP
jgi:hypothetical protein